MVISTFSIYIHIFVFVHVLAGVEVQILSFHSTFNHGTSIKQEHAAINTAW